MPNGKQALSGNEIMDLLAREGWQGPDLGRWHKEMAGVRWEALTVVFTDGSHGLRVTLARVA